MPFGYNTLMTCLNEDFFLREVTDVARDGMMSGPNIALLREVAERTDAKVTASGGISSLDDLRAIEELSPLGVDCAILGKSLYARAFTLEEALAVTR